MNYALYKSDISDIAVIVYHEGMDDATIATFWWPGSPTCRSFGARYIVESYPRARIIELFNLNHILVAEGDTEEEVLGPLLIEYFEAFL